MGQANLPVAGWQDHVGAFQRLGWTPNRGANHQIMTKPGVRASLSIPKHGTVKRQVIAGLLVTAGITEDEYLAAFHKGKGKKKGKRR